MAAKAVAEAFLKRTSGLVQSRTQLLDGNQLSKLALTIASQARQGLDADQVPENGTVVPPGWHLVYFTPSFAEKDLGLDGSDKSFNPDSPFTRRMWAGGKLQWHHASNNSARLRIGDTVTEHTRVYKADPKKNKQGDEMIVAGAEKTYETPDGSIALTDRREWVFRKELDPSSSTVATQSAPPAAASSLKAAAAGSGQAVKRYETTSEIIASSHYNQSAVSLFRFSALTFNAHQIHYNLPWTRDVEGHPEIVVHAPLNLVLMLELYREAHGDAKPPSSMEYRAVNPIYAHEDYMINLAESGEIWCEKGEQKQLCLTGRIQ